MLSPFPSLGYTFPTVSFFFLMHAQLTSSQLEQAHGRLGGVTEAV